MWRYCHTIYVCTMYLALIAQAVFIFSLFTVRKHRHTQTHRITDATDHLTHALANAGVGKGQIPREQFTRNFPVQQMLRGCH